MTRSDFFKRGKITTFSEENAVKMRENGQLLGLKWSADEADGYCKIR